MILTNGLTGEKIQLCEDEYSIGRSDSCDIVVREATLSRKHARIFRAGNDWYIEDLGSTNGLTVNGRKLASGDRRCLGDGDEVVLGTTVPLFFEREQEDEDDEKTVGVQYFRQEDEMTVRSAVPARPRVETPAPAPAPAPAQPVREKPAARPAAPGLSFRDFVENEADPKIRKSITAAAIILYVCCGITLILGIVSGSMSVLIDIAIILPLTILMHVKKIKGCAIALVCVGVLEFILSSLLSGTVSGYLPLIGSIGALVALIQADKAYKDYQNGNF